MEKKREIVKGAEENWKWKGEGMKMSGGLFSLFFSCHFFKTLKFVWGVPKWKFLRGKKMKMGNFLNLSTFDSTPGYAPEKYLHGEWQITLLL